MKTEKTRKPAAQPKPLAGQYRAIGNKAVTAALLFTRRMKPAAASAK